MTFTMPFSRLQTYPISHVSNACSRRLMHNNGIKAEIQFNKYIHHMVGLNVPTNFLLEE